MQVLMINNEGAGFADFINVEAGMTVEQLFTEQVKSGNPDDFLIRVNRLPTHREQVLQEGDRISITARKIEGA